MKPDLNKLLELKSPYSYSKHLAGLDFNRDIIEPGVREEWPDGVLGIRMDNDFWVAARLPYEYKDVPLKDIVMTLWPEYADQAVYCPDHGSIEQKMHFTNQWAEEQAFHIKSLNEENLTLREELERLRQGRYDLHERYPVKKKIRDRYFIEQYEHLLIAFAHPEQPRIRNPGICAVCGLYCSDRVHNSKFIEARKAGFEPGTRLLPLVDDSELDL